MAHPRALEGGTWSSRGGGARRERGAMPAAVARGRGRGRRSGTDLGRSACRRALALAARAAVGLVLAAAHRWRGSAVSTAWHCRSCEKGCGSVGGQERPRRAGWTVEVKSGPARGAPRLAMLGCWCWVSAASSCASSELGGGGERQRSDAEPTGPQRAGQLAAPLARLVLSLVVASGYLTYFARSFPPLSRPFGSRLAPLPRSRSSLARSRHAPQLRLSLSLARSTLLSSGVRA